MRREYCIEVETTVVKAICQRCGYEWVPKSDVEQIRMCPACKSRLWKTPKKEKG